MSPGSDRSAAMKKELIHWVSSSWRAAVAQIKKNHFDIFGLLAIMLLPLLKTGFTMPLFPGSKRYLEFSQTIFQHQNHYFSESFFFPLLARWLGATDGIRQFINFSICLNFFSLVAVFLLIRNRSTMTSLQKLALATLIGSDALMKSNFSSLGLPDPLTTLGAALLVFGAPGLSVFAGSLISCLSHFSLAIFLLINVALLRVASAEFTGKPGKRELLAGMISGAVMAKAIIFIWMLIFDYAGPSRIDWMIRKGIWYFIRYNREHWMDILKLQSLPHLLLFIALLALFFQRRPRLAWIVLACTGLSLIPLFVTIDRPRIFVLVFWPVLIYPLLAFFEDPEISGKLKMGIACFSLLLLIPELLQPGF